MSRSSLLWSSHPEGRPQNSRLFIYIYTQINISFRTFVQCDARFATHLVLPGDGDPIGHPNRADAERCIKGEAGLPMRRILMFMHLKVPHTEILNTVIGLVCV